MMTKLATVRAAKNMTQQHLSIKTGFTQGQISKWENGKPFSLATAKKLAKALNVALDELMEEINETIIDNQRSDESTG